MMANPWSSMAGRVPTLVGGQVLRGPRRLAAGAGFSSSPACANSLGLETINQRVRELEYAVRGPLVSRSQELARELKGGAQKPFKSVISANIGDCHAMNQRPITFIRQAISCASDGRLLASPDVPGDVKERVREILAYCGGQSVGSYSDSCGIEIVRRHVAEYIEHRDEGVACDWRNVFLSTGASQCVKLVSQFINHSRQAGKPAGIMIPIPQYPLYSATLCELGMRQVNYYLNEDADWQLNVEELERAYELDKDKCDIRGIVVINPGNPTGSVLSEDNIVEVLRFANERQLVVMADEVYQHNIYDEGSKFHSFKKVMSTKTDYKLELASMMSASKGFMGECGLRAGYCELANFDEQVRAMLYKGLSSWLCSSTLGQVAMDCVVRPPVAGEESYELFRAERGRVLAELKRKASLVADTFNSVEGVASNRVAGAMYAYPRLSLPEGAVREARSRKLEPDFFYCLQFLESFGVCVVPGSGFGQAPGTYHFRTTILPQPDVFEDMMDRFRRFHAQFLAKYS